MKRTSIKQGFGGEVAFTKFISEDRDTAECLLNSLNLSYEDGYTVTPEEHTNDKALEAFKIFVAALENQEITV